MDVAITRSDMATHQVEAKERYDNQNNASIQVTIIRKCVAYVSNELFVKTFVKRRAEINLHTKGNGTARLERFIASNWYMSANSKIYKLNYSQGKLFFGVATR